MAERLVLEAEVDERALSEWSTIAVELLGAESVMVAGKRWNHHVIHMGSGEPLFMYHGVGGHAQTYARTLPQIAAAGYHVYAVDALFHGESSKPDLPDEREMTGLQAEAVLDLMDALGFDRVHYEGESMGAAIGQVLAMKHPDRIEKLILNGFGWLQTKKPASEFVPTAGPSLRDLYPLSVAAVADPSYENIANRLHWLVKDPSRITAEMVQLRQRLYQDPEINAAMRQVFRVGQPSPDLTALAAAAPSEDDIREVWRSETLILWSDHNPGRGPDFGEYVADLLGAKFYSFADAGHWPQWEKPDEYSQVIVEFLRS